MFVPRPYTQWSSFLSPLLSALLLLVFIHRHIYWENSLPPIHTGSGICILHTLLGIWCVRSLDSILQILALIVGVPWLEPFHSSPSTGLLKSHLAQGIIHHLESTFYLQPSHGSWVSALHYPTNSVRIFQRHWNIQSRTSHLLQVSLSTCSPAPSLAPLTICFSSEKPQLPLSHCPLPDFQFHVPSTLTLKQVLNPPVALHSHSQDWSRAQCFFSWMSPRLGLCSQAYLLPGGFYTDLGASPESETDLVTFLHSGLQ